MEVGSSGSRWRQRQSGARGSGEGSRRRIRRLAAQPRLWEGQDVLARWSDGLLYLGNIRKVNASKRLSLVRFDDNSEFWVLSKDIHPPAVPGTEHVCCMCKDDVSSPNNLVVKCVKCKHGYHQTCHPPRIEGSEASLTAWACRQCVFAVATKKGGALKKGPYARAMLSMKQVLPYQLTSLDWDPQHLKNEQQRYCYCGGPGDWNVKMLQCYQCQHWFHEACTQCLSKPLLYGDRFYQFTCCVCTAGPEHVRRLPLSWVELTHLVVYHLTICCRRKYFDFEREILAFANENWDILQVGELSGSSKQERYTQILNALNSHRSRFVSGKEIKKRKCIFGLQERSPPPPPPQGPAPQPPHHPARPPDISSRSVGARERRSPRRSERGPGRGRGLASRTRADRGSRRARRLLDRARSQEVVTDPFSPNQSYTGSRGVSDLIPPTANIQRTPPKMMFASIQPTANTARTLPPSSSSSSSQEYGETPVETGWFLPGADAFADPPASPRAEALGEEEEEEEEEEEMEEDEDEEVEEDVSDPQADAKSPCDSSEDDLPLSYFRSSVSGYLGAMGRLARGETVSILARRVTLDGKVQYLVEWGGSSMF